MAHRLLGAAGYHVVGEAGDAQSAVAAVRRMRPQLVLLDVLLTDGDGIAVADQIGGHGDGVVVLTSSRSAVELGPALRGSSYVAKADLTVRSWLGRPDTPGAVEPRRHGARLALGNAGSQGA